MGSTKNRWLRQLSKQWTLRRILADDKTLSKEKRDKIKENLKVVELEVLELERKMKAVIPKYASGKNYGKSDFG